MSTSHDPPSSGVARRDGPVLIHALSGMGKSTLAAQHPDQVLDADRFLYAAVAKNFPDLGHRAGLHAWRALCRRRPWVLGGADLDLWARTRRGWFEPLLAALRSDEYRLIVTSLRDPPGVVATYYGIERGRYAAHLALAGRAIDNHQSEAMNDRLAGYSPLVRLPPGSWLSDQPAIQRLLAS